MPNQYRPEKRSIGNLLSTTNPPIVVPDWQRSYSWTTQEAGTFWNDLLQFDAAYSGTNIADQEYFLGSIVIVDATAQHLLLDGQQRVATSAILISVMRDFLDRYSHDSATRTQARYLGDFDDGRNAYTYKVTLNEYDRDYFKRLVLEQRTADWAEPGGDLASHERIKRVRVFFTDALERFYLEATDPEAAHHRTLRLLDTLVNHFSVVAIFSSDEDNAASVFETLNDRGIGLSTPDLLRNLVLRRATPESRPEIIDLWGEILEIETEVTLKAFLRHYWISHHGDIKSQSLYRQIKSTILAEGMNSLELSRDLRDASIVYRDLLSGNDSDAAIAAVLNDISALGAKLLYPALLSAKQVLEPGDFGLLAVALRCAFVRHSLVGQLENSLLENVVFQHARELRAGRPITGVLSDLRNFLPTDDVFQAAFAQVSVPRQASARYLLRSIESAMRRTAELEVGPPDRVHLEHIYPQTPTDGHRLPNHAQLLNRLGNLTLLASRLNTGIRNVPFDRKKPAYDTSELLITQDLRGYDEWHAESIAARQEMFSDLAPTLWSLPVVNE